HFPVRSAIVARDSSDLLQALRATMSKGESTILHKIGAGILSLCRHTVRLLTLMQINGELPQGLRRLAASRRWLANAWRSVAAAACLQRELSRLYGRLQDPCR